MAAIERMFMQIFDRKQWIEDQLRHQVESCGQSLGFNIVADGRNPPPWLLGCDGSEDAGVMDGLSKNQLLFGNLFPASVTTPSTNLNVFYNFPELKIANMPQFNILDTEMCTTNMDKVQDCTFDQEDKHLEHRATVEIDSLSKIQRSRSRQKDLENRLSKKAKSCSSEQDSILGQQSGKNSCHKKVHVENVDVNSSLKTSSLFCHDKGCVEVGAEVLNAQSINFPDAVVDLVRPLENTKSGGSKVTGFSTLLVPPISETAGNLHLNSNEDPVMRPALNGSDINFPFKTTHSAAPDLPLVQTFLETKKLNFDDIDMCPLDDVDAAYHNRSEHNSAELASAKNKAITIVQEDFCSNIEHSSCSTSQRQHNALHLEVVQASCTACKALSENLMNGHEHEVEESLFCSVSAPSHNVEVIHQTPNLFSAQLEDHPIGSSEGMLTKQSIEEHNSESFQVQANVESNNQFCTQSLVNSEVCMFDKASRSILNKKTVTSLYETESIACKVPLNILDGDKSASVTECFKSRLNGTDNSQSKLTCQVKYHPAFTGCLDGTSCSDPSKMDFLRDSEKAALGEDLKRKLIDEAVTDADLLIKAAEDGNSVLLLSETDGTGNCNFASSTGITDFIGNDTAELDCETLFKRSSISSSLSGVSAPDDCALPCFKNSAEVLTAKGCQKTPNIAGSHYQPKKSEYLSRNSFSTAESLSSFSKSTSANSIICSEPKISEILIVNAQEGEIENIRESSCKVTQNVQSDARYFLRSSTSKDKAVASAKSIQTTSSIRSRHYEGVAYSDEISSPKRRKTMHHSESVCPISAQVRLDGILNDSIDLSNVEEASSESASVTAVQIDLSAVQTKEKANLETADGQSGMEDLHQSKKLCVREDALWSRVSNQVVGVPPMQELSKPSNCVYDLVDCDGTMPEYEGFSLGVPESPVRVAEGASLFNQLGGSALTPNTQLLSRIPDVIHSLPTSFLEQSNFKTSDFDYNNPNCFSTSEDEEIPRANDTMGSSFDSHLLGRPFSDMIPTQCAGFEWNPAKPPMTPLFERFNVRRVSVRSGASSGSNPEFVCFRIDENSSINEECDDLDKLDGSDDGGSSEGIMMSENREALGDVTSMRENIQNVVPLSEGLLHRSNSSEENSFSTSQIGVHPLNENCRTRSLHQIEDKENQPPLPGKSRNKTTVECLNSRSSQNGISGKADKRNRSQGIISKGCKPNNIVSNISSFIPLVQKKQEPVNTKGKKDIRVKALEAAEAAKRLEEKKQNEREMRKATAKLERERLELEKRLKQKQEEEKKKKEAEIAARKRQREEDEKREKERKKRLCVEESRKLQKEREEIIHAGNDEKWRKAMDEKELQKKSMDYQSGPVERVGNVACKRIIETEPRLVKAIVTTGGLKAMVQDRSSTTEENQECQSYEMSPYRDSSDDEDTEDESITRKKFVPSWARKENLGEILLSNQRLNPREIFSRKSSFDLSEVLYHHVARRPV